MSRVDILWIAAAIFLALLLGYDYLEGVSYLVLIPSGVGLTTLSYFVRAGLTFSRYGGEEEERKRARPSARAEGRGFSV